MAANSKIEWTHHTFNPWSGCTKVSAGCANCYAAVNYSVKMRGVVWGPQGNRVIKAESGWKEPIKWNRDAQHGVCVDCGKPARQGDCECGQIGAIGKTCRPRVFCASLADVFEAADTMPAAALPAVRAARVRLFDLIRLTPNLDWLLLTKRPENWRNVIEETLILCQGGDPDDKTYFEEHGDNFPAGELAFWLNAWLGDEPPANVWMGTSVENQPNADKRVPELLKIPAVVRFLSCEPLLGAVRLPLKNYFVSPTRTSCIDWVIVGGESGPKAKPMHPDWARSLRDQCQVAGVAFFFKQWGEYQPTSTTDGRQILPFGKYLLPSETADGKGFGFLKVGKHDAGRLLDGREYSEFPNPAPAAPAPTEVE